MGRRMRPLDPAAGPVERFASELRELRSAAGDPPFWKMARRCTVSKSTMAAATAGRQLPTEHVLQEFVVVCGGDWLWWRDRLQRARADLAAVDAERGGAPAASEAGALVIFRRPPSALAPTGQSRNILTFSEYRGDTAVRRLTLSWPRRAAVFVLVVALSVLIDVAVSGAWSHSGRAMRQHITSPAVTPRGNHLLPGLTVNDGDDPRVDGCASASDAEQAILGSVHSPFVPIIDAHGHTIGDLGIWHNARCGASWAEASYRNPGLYKTIITLHRPVDGAAVVTEVTENLPFNAIIGQLLRTDTGCVWAVVKVDIPKAAPLSAKTPCEV